MPPRYTLGLNLENEDDYQGGLSRAVEEALLPSVSEEVAPTPAYSYEGPKINLGELQDSTPAVTEDTAADTNYLAQLMGQANEVKTLREKASKLAAQELSPEQSIASAILSAVPALLGLAAAGKRGFVGAGSVSGPAGALYAEARRKDMLEQSRQVGSQADALQQALQLGMRERGAEERQAQRDKAALERTNAAITAATNKEDRKYTEQQNTEKRKALNVARADGLIPKLDPETGMPFVTTEKAKDAAINGLAAARNINNLADRLETEWSKSNPSERNSLKSLIVGALKSDDVLNLGAALTGVEIQNTLGYLPTGFSLDKVFSPTDIATIMQQNIDGYGGKQAAVALRSLTKSLIDKSVGRGYEIIPDGQYGSLLRNPSINTEAPKIFGFDRAALERRAKGLKVEE